MNDLLQSAMLNTKSEKSDTPATAMQGNIPDVTPVANIKVIGVGGVDPMRLTEW